MARIADARFGAVGGDELEILIDRKAERRVAQREPRAHAGARRALGIVRCDRERADRFAQRFDQLFGLLRAGSVDETPAVRWIDPRAHRLATRKRASAQL